MTNSKLRRIRRKILAAKFEGNEAKKLGITKCPYPVNHIKYLPWYLGYNFTSESLKTGI